MGKTHDPSHGKNPHSSPDHAINAASRVFNTVDLVGKSTKEVIKLLGDPVASNNSIYNFPFWPPPEHGLVYRFDTGAYGWQFNVETQNDIVVSVEKLWIH
ncbi:MAG: hypothetical protein COA78_23845 [Blastopirellula sp.]|nr:MAG: hypothetical protein COA78_23845 [Blastopirellula sp.]